MWTAEDVEERKKGSWTAEDVESLKKSYSQPKEIVPEPQPSTWSKVKSGTGKAANFVKDTAKDNWSKAGDAVKKAAGWVAGNTVAGIGDFSNAFYRIPQSLGGDKIPGLNKALDYGVQSTKHFQNKGNTDPASQVYRSMVGMAPNIALAYLSQGASLPYQMPAYGGEAVRQATMQMLKSPAFQLAFLRSYGSGAGEAMDAGSNRVDAISAGLQQAIPQAMIEVGGGVEKLPEKAGQSLLKIIGKTALEEGMEEVAQYPFEGLAKKATYAPETPIFSLNEQAVINPIQQAQAGLVGGLAGGLMGGAGGVFNNIYNAPNVQTDIQTEPSVEPYSPPSDNVFYADQYGNVTQDQNFRPFLQLPPGPDFQAQQAVDARPQADFYTDPYGHTSADPNYKPALQLPPASNQYAETNPETIAKFNELENLNTRISEIENDPMRIWEDASAAEAEITPQTTAQSEGLFIDYYPERRAADVITSSDFQPATVEADLDPESYVTIYRGAPENQGSINNGDWVTTNEQLARDYAGPGKVITDQVQAKYLYAPIGEGIDELIYSTNTAETTPYVSTEITPQDTSASELENLKSQRDKLQSELQGEKYQATDDRFSAIDNLDKTSLNELSTNAESITESLINDHIEFLKMTSGQGVEQGSIFTDQWGDVTGRHGRVSNNEKWYQDWARENGYKKLSNKDLRDIAIKHLTEGVDTLTAGHIPPNQNYIYGTDLINYINMRRNLIDDAPYVANRNIEAPSRVMPGEMERLQGLDVQRQSEISNPLSMLNPPIAEPDYQSATGQVDTPFRVFPGERITPLEEMLSPVDPDARIQSPLENFMPPITSQETRTDVPLSTQANTQARGEAAATVEPSAAQAAERTFTDVPGTPGYKQRYKQWLRSEMDALLDGSDNAKDKAGWKLSREIPERNTLDVFGEESGKKINEKIFRPIHDNEAKRTTFINKYVNRIKNLNLSKSESKYVQMLGEGKITEADLPAGMDKAKINNAIGEFRKTYDGLLNLANKVLVQNGYDPVDYRKDYFPHFDSPDDPFVKAMKAMGFKVDNISLPTDIAGITHQFRPGKKWFGNFLERTGDKTTFDALEGFERYLHGISDVIYHTNDIQRLRAFETSIRNKYAPDNIKNRIAEIEASDLSMDEQQAAIDALFQMDRGHLGSYVTNLREYTDTLAGKKSISDRNMEHKLGRATYNIFDNMNTQVARNMVGWNVGSWLTNFIPIAQAGGGIKTKNLLKATQDTVFNYINDDGFRGKSTFLTNRKGTDRLTRTSIEKLGDAGAAPMEFIDDIATQILVRGKYLDNIEHGMSHQQAINNADDYTAGAVADRSKGALPTIFNTRNPLTKLFTMFQTEVNNQYSFLFKDLPREAKELGGKWLATTLLKAMVGSFLYNEIYEKFAGRRPTVDPIGTTIKALKQDTPLSALQAVGEDVLEHTPFIGGLMGGGRLPTQAALPEFGKMWDTAKDIQEDGFTGENVGNLLSGALKNPLTYLVSPIGGGGQAKKMIEGISAYNQGASMSGTGRMRFPIEQTPGSRAKTTLFGQYAAPEAREYFDKNRSPLSEKQTQQTMQSSDPKAEYERFMLQREIDKIQQEIKATAKDQSLTNAEKDSKIIELRQKIEQLRAAQ